MTKNASKDGLLSLTQLAAKLHVNRNTLSRKLTGLKHTPGPKGARLYRLSEVEGLLDEEQDPALGEARRRKVEAEAQLLELKLQRERGQVALLTEVRDYAQRLFRGMHNRIAQRFPREISHQLYKAESPAHVADVLEKELGRIFNEIREDHTRFFTEEGEQGGGRA